MKSYAATISVNPSTQTAGEKFTQAASVLEKSVNTVADSLRNSVNIADADDSSLLPVLLKLVFGVSGRQSGLSAPMDAVTLIARCALGIFVIAIAALGLGNANSALLYILGFLTIGGFMTRLSLITLAITQLAAASSLTFAGMHDVSIIVTVTAAVIALIGPGHSSLDAFIERYLSRKATSYLKRRDNERRDSYRAFQYSE